MRWTRWGPRRFTRLPKSLKGKVVVITGANTGIGKINATLMAKLGAKVVMACRDMAKAHIAAEDVAKEAKQSDDDNVVVMKLDLSSLASVRQFAKELSEKVSQIDILINNAGVMMCPHWKTDDGFEMQFGTNHLGHFLMTLLLLPLLRRAPAARIINVSSVAHLRGKINFDDINSDTKYNKMNAYSQSKLANVLFTRELANKLSDTRITCYALHPGVIDTDLYRHMDGFLGFMTRLFNTITMISADLGAQTTHYCALEESLSGETGRYYKNCGRVDNMVPNAKNKFFIVDRHKKILFLE
ncbi:retinol dehydrogenase 12-like [Oppia nitens]|uniref:retinol dehydrogenase 12-like n=1 Tax=Oppia nitens TaxID=1686743 RepID=UPI0023DC62DF|nr:retinol dehydrogenase 12-like [Oppia nitens]